MIFSINITKTAEKDLISAINYIEFTLCNPQAADALLDKSTEQLSALSTIPERYGIIDDPFLEIWQIRFIQIDNYLAFYTISEEAHTVTILRFLYGRRDWISILRGDFSPI